MSTDQAPHDLQLELALLALVLTDNAKLDRVTRLEPEHFFDAVNREVFTVARDLRRDGRPIDLVTLGSLMGGDPLGGSASILESIRAYSMAGELPDATSVEDALVSLYTRRRMLAAGEALAVSVLNYAAKPADVIEATMRELEDIHALSQPARRTLWDAEAGIDAMLREMEADNSANYIPTGIKSLNDMTGGWRRRELTYLGGRTSMGKSAIAVCVGTNAAKAGHGVLIISLEMGMHQWLARVASEAAYSSQRPVPYARALKGELNQSEREDFARAAMRRATLPMRIDERSGLSAMQIAAETRKAQAAFERQGKRLGLVIVDHIGKVRPSSRYKGNKVHEIGETSQALAHLAKAEDVAVLGLVQLNRGVEGRENKRPGLPDLRDSGDLEQDADAVLFAYRPAYYLARGKEDEGTDEERLRLADLERKKHVLEINVAKQRNGPAGTVELWCDMASNVVCDLDNRRAAA